MRVAAERDRVATLVVPPAHDPGIEWKPGVDLERAAGSGQGTQDGPVLLLEVSRVERATVHGPPSDRVIDVGEYREEVRQFHHTECFGEVGAHEPSRTALTRP